MGLSENLDADPRRPMSAQVNRLSVAKEYWQLVRERIEEIRIAKRRRPKRQQEAYVARTPKLQGGALGTASIQSTILAKWSWRKGI